MLSTTTQQKVALLAQPYLTKALMDHTQRGVVVQPGVGLAQLTEHLGREAIALSRAVDANLQDCAVHGAVNLAFGVRGGVHDGILELESPPAVHKGDSLFNLAV